jgi:hypothetical protein
MKKFVYCSLFVMASSLTLLTACKKTVKGCTNPQATNYNSKANKDDGTCVLPSGNTLPTNNYVIFTLNGPGFVNRQFVLQTDKPTVYDVTRNEYNETSTGMNWFNLDVGHGDTLIQIRLADKTNGFKPFVQGAVYFSITNIGATNPMEATSEDGPPGGYNVTAFTPTKLMPNGSSGAIKGKATVDATFSGTLVESTTNDTYTVTGGHVKLDGN